MQRSTVDTLIEGRCVIPVEPEGVALDNHAIAVTAGKIVAVLPAAEARQRFEPKTTVILDRHVLIPGLVNAHTHAAMALFRGLADDLALMDWLNHHIWPAEQKWVNPDFVRDGSHLAIAEMLRGGTTCFNDMYFFPDHTAAAAGKIGIRVVVGLIVIDFPTAWAADSQEYFTKAIKVHDDYIHHPLVTTAFAPHAPYTVSDENLKRVVALAEELDLNVHMHVHETRHEVDSCLTATGMRPLERLLQIGLLSPRLAAVHMTQLTDDEAALMATHNVSVIHCPHSNLKLASGFCPVQKLDRAGVTVAIGTDGAASNNSLDMFAEMRTAALLAKAVGEDPTAIPAARALTMATLNGARALGLDHQIGSLVTGKAADIVAVRCDDLEMLPVYDVISQVVYAAGRQFVSDVWVAGKRVVHDGSLCTIDVDQIQRNTALWEQRIETTDAGG